MLDRIVAKAFTLAYGTIALVLAGCLAVRHGELTSRPSRDTEEARKRCKSSIRLLYLIAICPKIDRLRFVVLRRFCIAMEKRLV